MAEIIYQGGNYLNSGGWEIRGSILDGTPPLLLAPVRQNETIYDPEAVLAPDSISDAFGRFTAFCIDDYPVLSYHPPKEIRLADMGVGSGIFSVSVVDGLTIPTDKQIHLDAIDTDPKAIATTIANIDRCIQGAPRPVSANLLKGDYLANLDGCYDFIYFNPPYLEEGHNIMHELARLAPPSTKFVADSTQEYRRVVPELSGYLSEKGMALIRLPREDAKVDAWVAEFMETNDTARLLLVQDASGREGRALTICSTTYPDAIGSYDYWENYLGGTERRQRAKSDAMPIYHDNDCEIVFIRRPAGLCMLGGQALACFSQVGT